MITIFSHFPLTPKHSYGQRLIEGDVYHALVHYSKSLDHHMERFSAFAEHASVLSLAKKQEPLGKNTLALSAWKY